MAKAFIRILEFVLVQRAARDGMTNAGRGSAHRNRRARVNLLAPCSPNPSPEPEQAHRAGTEEDRAWMRAGTLDGAGQDALGHPSYTLDVCSVCCSDAQ